MSAPDLFTLEPGEHYHRCLGCGHEWKHTANYGAKEATIEELIVSLIFHGGVSPGHACMKCGRLQRWQRGERTPGGRLLGPWEDGDPQPVD